ncbi:MAG: hypothetical protein DRG50_04640 [Deltaproteobacteria bacterium]|nr:MAG: hypothetical protein DRG50_04640 [Deltaproteobacteria bacterium]
MLIGGLAIARIRWRRFLITGVHGKMALLMLPFITFGLFSGFYMNRFKGRLNTLPLLHGINNVIVLSLALTQIVTGWMLYYSYVLVK